MKHSFALIVVMSMLSTVSAFANDFGQAGHTVDTRAARALVLGASPAKITQLMEGMNDLRVTKQGNTFHFLSRICQDQAPLCIEHNKLDVVDRGTRFEAGAVTEVANANNQNWSDSGAIINRSKGTTVKAQSAFALVSGASLAKIAKLMNGANDLVASYESGRFTYTSRACQTGGRACTELAQLTVIDDGYAFKLNPSHSEEAGEVTPVTK